MTPQELRRLLDAIGPEVPEADLDPRWDALAAGELSDDEAARLQGLAAASRDLRDAPDSFAPLDDDLLQRTADRLLDVRTAPVPADVPPLLAPADARMGPVDPVAAPEPSGWFGRFVEWLSTPAILGPALAVAALLIVVGPLALRAPTLPVYDGEILSGDKIVRGEGHPGDGTPHFAAGSTIEVRLAPQTEVGFDVAVTMEVVRDAGAVPVDVRVQRGAGGVLKVVGKMPEAATTPPGLRTLRLAVRPMGTPAGGPYDTITELPIVVGGPG